MMMMLLSVQELLATPPFHQPSLAVCAGAPGYASVPPLTSCCLCRSSWLCPRSTSHLLLSVQELPAVPPFHLSPLAVCAGAPGYAPVPLMTEDQQRLAKMAAGGSEMGKKEKKSKKRKFMRTAANEQWEDQTLGEWQPGKGSISNLIRSEDHSRTIALATSNQLIQLLGS